MFGRNTVVGQKHFAELQSEEKVSVTSIFGTLQGEGPYSGRRAVFVRLAKCQLACSFCLPAQTSIRVKREGVVKKIGIGDLEVGDTLFTAKGTNVMFETQVVNVHRRMVKRSEIRFVSYKVGLNQAHQYATVDHPFAVASHNGMVYKRLDQIKKGDHLIAYHSQDLDKGYEGKAVHKLKREVTRVDHISDDDWILLTTTQGLSLDAEEIEVVSPECYPSNNFIAGSGHMQMHNCDTYFDAGDSMTVDEVETKVFEQFVKFLPASASEYQKARPVLAYKGADPIIVFTGGEPGLQMHMLEQLVSRFVSEGLTCQIESNGIIPFTDYIWDNATVVISPKCSERNGVPTKYIKPHKTNLDKTQHLKFVVTSDTSSPYSEIPEWALDEQKARAPIGLKALTIYVSPMNIYNREPVKSSLLRDSGVQSDLDTRSTVDETISFWEHGLLNQVENQKNHEHAAKLCMETGAVLSLQTHLYASLP